ncbi:MAG: YciI family protein [Chromatiales bacterium]
MFYVIIGEDNENSLEKRVQVRLRHLDRLNQLKDQGRMLLAGPFPAIDSPDPGPAGFTGSMIVAEFESLAAAEAWANADPYLESGVYKRVTVKPFKKVMP